MYSLYYNGKSNNKIKLNMKQGLLKQLLSVTPATFTPLKITFRSLSWGLSLKPYKSVLYIIGLVVVLELSQNQDNVFSLNNLFLSERKRKNPAKNRNCENYYNRSQVFTALPFSFGVIRNRKMPYLAPNKNRSRAVHHTAKRWRLRSEERRVIRIGIGIVC